MPVSLLPAVAIKQKKLDRVAPFSFLWASTWEEPLQNQMGGLVYILNPHYSSLWVSGVKIKSDTRIMVICQRDELIGCYWHWRMKIIKRFSIKRVLLLLAAHFLKHNFLSWLVMDREKQSARALHLPLVITSHWSQFYSFLLPASIWFLISVLHPLCSTGKQKQEFAALLYHWIVSTDLLPFTGGVTGLD